MIIIFKEDIDIYIEDGKLLRKNKIDNKDCKILGGY